MWNSVSRELYDVEVQRRIEAEAEAKGLNEQIRLLKEQLKESNERERDLIKQLAQPKSADTQPDFKRMSYDEIMAIPAHTRQAREARFHAAGQAKIRDEQEGNGKAELTDEQKRDIAEAVKA